MTPILEGLLTGIGTIIFIGPVFFTLLKITLDHGLRAGFLVALGIIMSDVLIVGLFYWGALDLFQDATVQYWFALVGSLILFGMGLKYILRPAASVAVKSVPSALKSSGYFAKGFLVNFVNPFVFLVWISLIAYADGAYGSAADVRIYLIAALVGILATDSLKVVLASQLHRVLKPSFLKKVYFFIGLILIGFGARLLWFIAMQA